MVFRAVVLLGIVLSLLAGCRSGELRGVGGEGADAGKICIGPACPPRCGALADCAEECVDLQTDATHCGSCGTSCSFAHAAAACTNGACAMGTCAQGFADCDGNPANGCEADLLSDTARCGTCSNTCPAVAVNTVSTCEAGVCKAICAPGMVVCNGQCRASCANWKWTNPVLSANNLYAADFFDANLGLAGGDYQLLRTTNGGQSWTSVVTNLIEHIEVLHFVTQTRVVAMGFNLTSPTMGGAAAVVIVSDDAGLTWRSVSFPSPSAMLLDLAFDGPNGVAVGMVGTSGAVFLSEDAGLTWTQRSVPASTGWLHGVELRGQKVWAVGDSGILVSSDLGTSWAAGSGPGLTAGVALRGVTMRDDQVGLAVGYDERIFRTTDGGASWTRQREGVPGYWLRRVRFFDATRAIAVGFQGLALRSSDGGLTWSAPSGRGPYAVSYFFSVPTVGSTAWSVGTRGVIERSDDYGATWTRTSPGFTAGWTRAAFPTPTRGYMVGELGGVVGTVDGGKTWDLLQGQHSPYASADWRRGLLGNSLRGVHFVSALEGWAVGDPVLDATGTLVANAVILHTLDGGQSWTLQASGTPSSLKSVGFSSALKGWAAGNGVLLRTDNGGGNWTRLMNVSAQVNDIAVLSDNEVWLACNNALLHTIDGGISWTMPAMQVALMYSVRFADSLHGLAAGTATNLQGGIFSTQDGGRTWAQWRSGDSDLMFGAVLAADLVNGVAGSTSGKIWRTRDGGRTWAVDLRPTFNSWFDVRAVDDGFVVLGEMGNAMWGPLLPPT